MLKSQKGFGLLTLFATLLLASLFITYVVASKKEWLSSVQLQETERKVQALRLAINKYKLHHETASYVSIVGAPSLLSDLVNDTGDACVGDNVSTNSSYLRLQGWCGPYLDQKVSENLLDYQRDGWGHPFLYNSVTEVITSYGPNGSDDSGGGDDLVFNP